MGNKWTADRNQRVYLLAFKECDGQIGGKKLCCFLLVRLHKVLLGKLVNVTVTAAGIDLKPLSAASKSQREPADDCRSSCYTVNA